MSNNNYATFDTNYSTAIDLAAAYILNNAGELAIDITPEMYKECMNRQDDLELKRPGFTERMWQAGSSCCSLFSSCFCSNKSEVKPEDDKKDKMTWSGKALRIGTGLVSSGISYFLMTKPYSPFTHLFNMMSNKGWRSLTDLDNLGPTCKTATEVAKKYLPLGVLAGAAALADNYVLKIVPVQDGGLTYFVVYLTAVLAIQDYSTWMAGGKSKGGD